MNVTSLLGSRAFLEADQEAFAALSGDRNPMHMDAVAARRTQAGAPVVHGVHAMLWALDVFARARPERGFTEVKVRFERFLYVGERIEAVLECDEPDKVSIELRTDGARAGMIVLGFGSAAPLPTPDSEGAAAIGAPAERTIDDLPGLSGAFALACDLSSAEAAFPALAGMLGARRVRALAGLSTLVGMECPGLLSIFSKLAVRLGRSDRGELGEGKGDDDALRYAVRRVQPLLRSVSIDLDAPGIVGSVEAFVRQPPVVQPSVDVLRPRVPVGFARGDRVLVVGGSRGLGELTAKLAALGGAEVVITYATGSQDAEAVVTALATSEGSCQAIRFDIRAPIEPQLAALDGVFTHCYYYATPPIFRKRGLLYDRAVLDNFMHFYVDAFAAVAQSLATANPAVRLFFPSTSAIDEGTKGTLEYVIAKQAGEALCAELDRQHPGVRILVERLPRILTDQTATVLPVQSADPLDLLLAIMTVMHSRAA